METMKTISEQCFLRPVQAWVYIKVVEECGYKFRVEIRRDAYDDRSIAKVEKWSGAAWEFVHSIPIEDCVCKKISYVMTNVSYDDFRSDSHKLIETAKSIVGI
jgi:hypothetical protein